MEKEEIEDPIYTEKVEKILAELGNGKTKERLAKDLGYSTKKSLDQYLRRKNFAYDPELGNYVPKKQKSFQANNQKFPAGSAKEEMILTLLEDEGFDDPKEVARKAGFNDHLRLAEFMKERGYSWDSEKNTYVIEDEGIKKEDSRENQKNKCNSDNSTLEITLEDLDSAEESDILIRLGRFLPLLEFLGKNIDLLEELLTSEEEKINQPNLYTLRGEPRTKNIYMSMLLAKLIEEFADLHGLTQREVVEAALVEYFLNNDFDRVENVLSSN